MRINATPGIGCSVPLVTLLSIINYRTRIRRTGVMNSQMERVGPRAKLRRILMRINAALGIGCSVPLVTLLSIIDYRTRIRRAQVQDSQVERIGPGTILRGILMRINAALGIGCSVPLVTLLSIIDYRTRIRRTEERLH